MFVLRDLPTTSQSQFHLGKAPVPQRPIIFSWDFGNFLELEIRLINFTFEARADKHKPQKLWHLLIVYANQQRKSVFRKDHIREAAQREATMRYLGAPDTDKYTLPGSILALGFFKILLYP